MQNSLEQITIKLGGLTCTACEYKIEKALKKLDGVDSVKVSFASSMAEIIYNSDKRDLNTIYDTIEKTGYEVVYDYDEIEEDSSNTSTFLILLIIAGLYIIIKNSDKFKLKLNIPKCIKYDSVELFNNIGFLLIFLFGLSNAINFGEKYTLALTFVALITDTQWDTAEAIVTAATIDISKNNFNYKEHRRNAYKLLGILFLTSLIMFSLLYRFYDLDFKITMIYFVFEIVNFLIYPIYRIKTCYLQLEWSSFKTTGNKIFSLFLRMLLSLTKNPFCTGIGQVCSSIYQFITVSIFFKFNFKVDKKGNVIRKKME